MDLPGLEPTTGVCDYLSHAPAIRATDRVSGNWASFSPDKLYRYMLARNIKGLFGPICVFVMLNPSAADHTQNDPTVARCQTFAQDNGFYRLYVANVFALRSTDPGALYDCRDPIGPCNDHYLQAMMIEAQECPGSLVVCAWGRHALLRNRHARMIEMIRRMDVEAWCYKLNKDGTPAHPLYQKRAAILKRFV